MSADEKTDAAQAAEVLQAVETTLDAVAVEHADHGCGTADIALKVSAAVRLKRESLGAASGPAQVATKRYRDNYDAIFMSKGGSA